MSEATSAEDIVGAGALARLAAVLDHAAPPWAPGMVPPLGHWLAFLPDARQSAIGADGHPDRSDFAPAAGLPRRMWAGSRVAFPAPLPVDALLTRTTTMERLDRKDGRSGALLFVTLRHEISAAGVTGVVEEQDIVYRPAVVPDGATVVPPTQPPTTPLPAASWSRTLVPDEAMLFRFSALTFNAHRIHYDREFARSVEGYPGLVVHGPLTATLLMDLYLREVPGAAVSGFTFRGERPLFAGAPLHLHGRHTETGAALWATNDHGALCMRATIEG